MANRLARACCTAAAFVVVVGTASVVPPEVANAVTPAGRAAPKALSCNPAHLTSCVLPYPSDAFARPDSSTATGVRLAVSDDVWPQEFRAQLPPSLAPSMIFDGHDGFSANGPILFEMPGPIDPESLPPDGGDALVVYDMTSGQRVPMLVEVDHQAATHNPAATVLRAWPATRFPWGHHFVAALTTSLRMADGSAPGPIGGFAAILDGTAPARWTRYHRPLLAALTSMGHARESLVSVTGFTVRSEADATGRELARVERARSDDHPVSGLRVIPMTGEIAALVAGFVRITDFRDPEDAHMATDAAGGHEASVPFLFTVPRSSADRAAPVVVYSHGLTATKETFAGWTATNARRGMATIAIDHPQHGWRANPDKGLIQYVASPANAARLLSIPPESAIDFVSLVKAVKTSLANLDVAPFSWRTLLGVPADGRADLDPSHIVVEGTSMGGVLGLTFFGVEPALEAGHFQVPGVGIMHILTGSVVWNALGLDGIVPVGATGADMSAAIAACQFVIDEGDPVNFLGRAQAKDRPLVIEWGQGDSVVPNYSTRRLIALTGLPHLSSAAEYRGGSGEFMEPPLHPLPPPFDIVGHAMAHLSFEDPDPVRVMESWLDYVAARTDQGRS